MILPDGRPLVVAPEILVEPSPPGRVVLWVPAGRRAGLIHWDRVTTPVGATVVTDRGVCSIAAASVPAREPARLALGGLLRRLVGRGGDPAWTLPDGSSAVACGPRQADAVLAWSEPGTAPLDDARIRRRWPESRAIRPLGPDLRLVHGVGRSRSEAGPSAPPEGSPRALAEAAMAVARGSGDRPGAVLAMIDLGVTHLHDGDNLAAVGVMEAALGEARGLGDPAREADVASNLALALLRSGEPARARDLLLPVLAQAQSAGDRYAETLALDRLAHALLGLGDAAGALAHLERAGDLAEATGDLRHAADLLWRAAILQAETGHRDHAAVAAEAAIDRFRRLEHPAADWYGHHLEDYRSGVPSALATRPPPGVLPEMNPATPGSPGLLRMAITATEAMAKFVGSGFKRASSDTYRERLAVCGACEHHTGVRCRICGCLTLVKAGALHERCPAGRWPPSPCSRADRGHTGRDRQT